MSDVSEYKKRQYEKFKSKAHIYNVTKRREKKRPISYGVFVERVCAGYWHNGVWRVRI